MLVVTLGVSVGTASVSADDVGDLPEDDWVSLESYKFPGRYVRHAGFSLWVHPYEDARLFKQDATFLIVSGLADEDCVSLESYNFPGRYVHHDGFYLRLDPFVDAESFKQDATFCPRPGLAGPAGVSLESYNLPGRYVRDTGFILAVDAFEDTDPFKAETTFFVSEPLAPEPVFNPDNGHWYEIILVGGISWDEAKDAANAKVLDDDCQGHLATVTTSAENTFLDNLNGDIPQLWLGGFQDPPDITPADAGWTWVTDEPWEYTNWSPNEPNDYGWLEQNLSMYSNGTWNDIGPHTQHFINGYFVEYGTDCDDIDDFEPDDDDDDDDD